MEYKKYIIPNVYLGGRRITKIVNSKTDVRLALEESFTNIYYEVQTNNARLGIIKKILGFKTYDNLTNFHDALKKITGDFIGNFIDSKIENKCKKKGFSIVELVS